jgi:hypothetical protein
MSSHKLILSGYLKHKQLNENIAILQEDPLARGLRISIIKPLFML